jgi:FkbM family methyltransferase
VIHDPKSLVYFEETYLSEYAKFLRSGGDHVLVENIGSPIHPIVVVGGYKGDSTSEYLLRTNSKVYVIEPIPEFAQTLSTRFTGIERVQIFNYALGGTDGEVLFSLAKDATGEFCSSAETMSVPMVTWETFLDFFRLTGSKIGYIEMNIEGGEYSLLESMISTNQMRNIQKIAIQFHKVDDFSATNRAEIRNKLKLTHRNVLDYEWIWEIWEIAS